MSDEIKLELAKIPTPALERWLRQYESFVAQTKAELDKRFNPEITHP